jgi:glycosyltransferase involved in cell wall biosynthesis
MIVVGDGPSRARLTAAHPAATFVGAKRDAELAAHYASADAFLFPSLSDTFGNVVLEALASGLPVVSFNCAAAAEHVDDGISGRLAAPGDDAAFMDAVAAFAVAPATLQSFRDAAVAAARRATWDEVLERFEARLQDTVDAYQASPAAVPVVA